MIEVRFTGGLCGPPGGRRTSDGLWFSCGSGGGSSFFTFDSKDLPEGPRPSTHPDDTGDPPPSTERLP